LHKSYKIIGNFKLSLGIMLCCQGLCWWRYRKFA